MEDFVPYELADKLKEKGFNESCYKYYQRGVLDSDDCWNRYNRGTADRCSAPTISQVLKWLRDKYSIHISTKPYPCEDGIMWLYEIREFNEYISFVAANKTGFIKEEQASLAGISYVLDNLI